MGRRVRVGRGRKGVRRGRVEVDGWAVWSWRQAVVVFCWRGLKVMVSCNLGMGVAWFLQSRSSLGLSTSYFVKGQQSSLARCRRVLVEVWLPASIRTSEAAKTSTDLLLGGESTMARQVIISTLTNNRLPVLVICEEKFERSMDR